MPYMESSPICYGSDRRFTLASLGSLVMTGAQGITKRTAPPERRHAAPLRRFMWHRARSSKEKTARALRMAVNAAVKLQPHTAETIDMKQRRRHRQRHPAHRDRRSETNSATGAVVSQSRCIGEETENPRVLSSECRANV